MSAVKTLNEETPKQSQKTTDAIAKTAVILNMALIIQQVSCQQQQIKQAYQIFNIIYNLDKLLGL